VSAVKRKFLASNELVEDYFRKMVLWTGFSGSNPLKDEENKSEFTEWSSY